MDMHRVSAGNWVIDKTHEASPVTGIIISTKLENGDAQQKDAGCYCQSSKRREEQHISPVLCRLDLATRLPAIRP